MTTKTKTYETIEDLRKDLPNLPEDATLVDRDGDPVHLSEVPDLLGLYAPYTVTYEVPHRSPLAELRATRINSALADLYDVASLEVHWRGGSPELRAAVRGVEEALRG
jgi:hypothetical protein